MHAAIDTTTPFMVQKNKSSNDSVSFELYIPHVGGESVELAFAHPTTSGDGCVIGLTKDRTDAIIHIGSEDDPLPIGLFEQLNSSLGLLLVEVLDGEIEDSYRYHLLSLEQG